MHQRSEASIENDNWKVSSLEQNLEDENSRMRFFWYMVKVQKFCRKKEQWNLPELSTNVNDKVSYFEHNPAVKGSGTRNSSYTDTSTSKGTWRTREKFNWLKQLHDRGGTKLTSYPIMELLSYANCEGGIFVEHVLLFFPTQPITFKFYTGLCTWDWPLSIQELWICALKFSKGSVQWQQAQRYNAILKDFSIVPIIRKP